MISQRKEKWCFWTGLLLVTIFILTGWVGRVLAEEKYPTRAIDIIVPFGPGGGIDLGTRPVAAYLSKKWGVPVNVVNKPGGKCIPATLEVYNAAPDGYTLLADNRATCSVLAATTLARKLPFKVMSRTFVTMASAGPYLYIVPSTSPFKTAEDFVAEAKKNPQNISFTSGDPGIESVIRLFFSEFGLDFSKMKYVMITGAAQAVTLTAGGHVTLGAGMVSGILPAIKGGTVRPLLTTFHKRIPDLPDVRTAAELGYPKLSVVTWVGISGPPKLPSYIIDVWNQTYQEMVKDPVVIRQWKNVGQFPFYHDSQASREYVKTEIEKLKKILPK